MSENLIETRRDQLVGAMLANVPIDGWTWLALETGAIKLGFKEGDARRIFINDLGATADHFALWSDRRMLAQLKDHDLESMRVRDRIYTCVKIRLKINAKHKEAMRRLLSFLALPQNTGLASKLAWQTCSEMWYASGDNSTDWNYYSKRALLASVYSSTVLYWMVDDGNGAGDFPETWGFLERRIDDVLRTFGIPRQIKQRLTDFFPAVSGFSRY